MYNQLEDVCVSILNLALMEAPPGIPFLGPEVLFASLDEYHSRLFANYYKWCDYVGTAPFPWRCPPWLEDSYCSEDANLKKVKTDCAGAFTVAAHMSVFKYQVAVSTLTSQVLVY